MKQLNKILFKILFWLHGGGPLVFWLVAILVIFWLHVHGGPCYYLFLDTRKKSGSILKENEVQHKDDDDDTDDVNDNDGDVEQDATSPPKRKKQRLVKVRDYIWYIYTCKSSMYYLTHL